MNMTRSRLFALAAAHGASLLAVPAVLEAQTTAGQIEEIVVTARQREERIEDVPVTITAFTQSEIQSAGIERPQDFIALTPGVAQVQTAEAGDMQVNIRASTPAATRSRTSRWSSTACCSRIRTHSTRNWRVSGRSRS